MRFVFINMPIEFYSPTSGGAIATIIAMTTKNLLAMGHEVKILSILDDNVPYSLGSLIELKVRRREAMGIVERKLRGLQNRLCQWDWPAYGEYLAQVRKSLRTADVKCQDCIISFNDLQLARYLPQYRNHWVWLQNECFSNTNRVRRTVRRLRGMLCCSEYIREWTISRYSVPDDSIYTLHSGVDREQFKPGEQSPTSTGLRCLFVGRLDPNKGVDLAIQAVAAVVKRGLPVCLSIVGGTWFYGNDSDGSHTYLRQLTELSLGQPVNFLGHRSREQLPEIYRSHDLAFVLSRSNEPFGLVTLEAMASGCAVIASNRGGLPEACGGAATLVDPDDLGSIVRALTSMAEQPTNLAEAKQAAIERCVQADWSAVAQNLVRIATFSRSKRPGNREGDDGGE